MDYDRAPADLQRCLITRRHYAIVAAADLTGDR
jgi:hypothetical protein